MALDIWSLKAGDVIRLEGGAIAQVAKPTEDGRWILIHYVEVPDNPDLAGTEDLCSEDEVISLAAPSTKAPKP